MLGAAQRAGASATAGPSNNAFLQQRLSYDGEKLLDADSRGVMMAWEGQHPIDRLLANDSEMMREHDCAGRRLPGRHGGVAWEGQHLIIRLLSNDIEMIKKHSCAGRRLAGRRSGVGWSASNLPIALER